MRMDPAFVAKLFFVVKRFGCLWCNQLAINDIVSIALAFEGDADVAWLLDSNAASQKVAKPQRHHKAQLLVER